MPTFADRRRVLARTPGRILPRTPGRVLAALGAAACTTAAIGGSATPAGATPRSAVPPAATGATVAGTVIDTSSQRPLEGMRVQAQPALATCSEATSCGPTTYSGPRGAYTLSGLAPGTYTIDVVDGSTTLRIDTVTVGDGASRTRLDLRLGAPAVPAGTVAAGAARDLRRLNAERARDGLPAGVRLNPRWSTECAAHDAYEAATGVLEPSEDPTAPGASTGGAWAGLNSVLAQGRWTEGSTPWESAPVHLLALLAPSLSVTGIDDSGTRQCAITWPGMLRAPVTADAVTTVPAPGARGVATSELARETPFTPVQFVGLPARRATGRELFVYLNRAGQTGQAPVDIVRATLTHAGRPLRVRWVDSSTRTLGPYLAGGIVIPVSPLRAFTTYRATVAVRDGTRTLVRSWSFTTR